MKWLSLVPLALLAHGGAAIAPDPALGPVPDSYDMCVSAFNCEMFKDTDGMWDFRVIPGLEYGTAAYEQHANKTRAARALTGPRGQAESREAANLEARQSSWNCGNTYCTGVWSSDDKLEYGTTLPRDVSDTLWDHCPEFHCDVDPWTYNIKHAKNGNIQVLPRTLTITVGGTFWTSTRRGIIFAVTEVMGLTQRSQVRRGGSPRFGEWQYTMWQAPSRVKVARFVRADGGIQGDLSVKITHESDGNFGCAALNAALAPAATAIQIFGGTVMGIVGMFCG